VRGGNWFKPHAHGFGAGPANWRGWLAVAVFVLAETALAFAVVGWSGDVSAARLGAYLVLSLILAVAFVAVAWRKTDGAWRWRWGERE
jgi:hypothetical protein